MAIKEKSSWSWRGLDIKSWVTISYSELVSTPPNILKSLFSTNLPIRVLENNIFRPEMDGVVESISINGSIKISIKSIDPNSTKRSKHNVITLDNKSNTCVGLPVFA